MCFSSPCSGTYFCLFSAFLFVHLCLFFPPAPLPALSLDCLFMQDIFQSTKCSNTFITPG